MNKIALASFIICAVPAWADIPRPETREETLEALHSAVLDAGFSQATIDREDVSITVDSSDDNSFTLFPDNLHRSLQGAADDTERQAILDGFIETLRAQMSPSDDFNRDQIMPRLQHQDYIAFAEDPDALQHRPFVGDLVITYVVDYPTHTASFSAEMMTEEDLTPNTLHRLAVENLIAASKDLRIESSTIGVYFLTLDGFYENAMMLDAEMWDSITTQIGQLAVTVPSRDFVMIAPRDDADVVAAMRQVRDDALAESPYPLSNLTFTWVDGAWDVLPE